MLFDIIIMCGDFKSPYIVPSSCMILRLFEQDVQISGTKTGSLVSATLENHAAVRESPSIFLGIRYWGVFFSWVLHFLDKQKRSASPYRAKPTRKRIKKSKIDWILAYASMTTDVHTIT